MALSEHDRDLIVRTALAEAGDGDPSTVIEDILSRAQKARITPSELVMQRGAYPSWDDPRKIHGIDAKGKDYQRVAEIVNARGDGPKPGSVLGAFGFNQDGTPKQAPAEPKPAEAGAVLRAFGHDINADTAAKPAAPITLPPGASGYVQIPGEYPSFIDAQGQFLPNPSPPGALEKSARSAGEFVAGLPSRYVEETRNALAGGRELASSGVADLRHAQYFPTTPSIDPRTWTGGGILKTAAGLGAQAISPLTGAVNVLGQEVDKLTGVPGTGEKAALLVPVPKVARAAKNATPAVNALNRMVRDIGEENLPAAIDRLESNPTLSIMDVAPGVQTRAIAIAKGEPSKGQTALFQTVEERNAAKRENVTNAFSSTIGKPPDTVKLLEKMKADARAVGREQIEPALAEAGPIDVRATIRAIDEEIGAPAIRALKEGRAQEIPLSPIQQRLLRLRQELSYHAQGEPIFSEREALYHTNVPATTNPLAGANDVGAHGVQSRLRYEADQLLSSATGSDRIMGNTLMRIRNKLVSDIDTAAGGKYSPALAAYRDEMHVQEAFDKGSSIASGARTGEAGLANRPESWAKWLEGKSDREIEAAQLGARVAIDNIIGTIRQAGRAGIDIPDAPFTRAKLEMLFGHEETGRLVRLLADEKAKAETNALLTRQSVTARAQAAQAETTPRTVLAAREYANRLAIPLAADVIQATQTGLPGMVTGGLLALGGAQKLGGKIGRAVDIARNNAYARIASTTSPEERNMLISVLRSRQTAIGQGNKITNALLPYFGVPAPR